MKAVVDRVDEPVASARHDEPAAPPSRARFAAFAVLFGLASGVALHALLIPDAGWLMLLLVVSLSSCLSSLAAMFVFRRMQLPLEAVHSLSAEQALRLRAYEDLSRIPVVVPPASGGDVADRPAPSQQQSELIDALHRCDAYRRQAADVLAASRDSLLIVNRDGRIEAASLPAAALIELTPAELRDRALASLFPLYDDSRPEPFVHPLQAAIQRLLGDHAAPHQTFAALLERRGRTSVQLQLHCQPLRDAASRVQSLLLRMEPRDPLLALDAGVTATRFGASDNLQVEPCDPLTGALGPQHLDQEIDRLQHEARRDATEHCLLLIALDHVDALHDRLGIAAGEQQLWQLAQMIRTLAITADGFHRISARHFALLLPRVTEDLCVARAESLCVDLAALVRPFADDGVRPTCSIGVVMIDSSQAAAHVLIDAATDAARRALALGGGVQRAVITSGMADADIAPWLAGKIEGKALRLAAQAILPTDPVPGSSESPWLELLPRLEDDDGVWLPMDRYAATVERLGLSMLVDEIVLDAALAHAIGNTRLSITLSGASLKRDDFLNGLRARLMRSAIPTPQLCFAVEERFILEHPQRASALHELLSPFGCVLVIDHYRGGSGLTALRHFPAQVIMLHASLVARQSTDLIDRAHLEWLAGAARLMGVKTVASAVRDADTRERMRLARVDYVQGYAVAPSVPFSS